MGGVGGGNHRKGNRNVMRPRNRLWKQNGNDPRDSSAASESRASYPATWQSEHGAGDVGVLQMSVVAPLLVGLGQGPGQGPRAGLLRPKPGTPLRGPRRGRKVHGASLSSLFTVDELFWPLKSSELVKRSCISILLLFRVLLLFLFFFLLCEGLYLVVLLPLLPPQPQRHRCSPQTHTLLGCSSAYTERAVDKRLPDSKRQGYF